MDSGSYKDLRVGILGVTRALGSGGWGLQGPCRWQPSRSARTPCPGCPPPPPAQRKKSISMPSAKKFTTYNDKCTTHNDITSRVVIFIALNHPMTRLSAATTNPGRNLSAAIFTKHNDHTGQGKVIILVDHLNMMLTGKPFGLNHFSKDMYYT